MSSNAEQNRVELAAAGNSPETPPRPPYTLVAVGDLGARGALKRATAMDRETFAALMEKARPTVAVRLPSPLGSGPEWELELAFDSLKSFEPAGLLRHIPAAQPRLALWECVRERRRGAIAEADVHRAVGDAVARDATLGWLQTAGDAPGTATPGALPAPAGGNILDLVDSPDAKRRVAADVERLANEAAERSARIGGAEANRLDAWLRRLHVELSAIAEALLKHPDVRRLETAWRSMKFLADRVDPRAGVQLLVLDAARDQAVVRLNEAVVEPAFAGEIRTPGMILFDYPCQNTPVDLALLDELGRCAASLPVPAVFPLDVAFFGVKTANLLKNLPNLAGLVGGWEFAKWRTLREQPHARWLVAVLGRFVLRAPYEASATARDFSFQEPITSTSQILWGCGHLAMGVCAARAFAQHGWPTRMFGAEAGKLENLPIVTNPTDAQKPWGPGDTVLPDRRIDELPAVGVNLLMSVPNTDHCLLLGGMTVAQPVVTAEVGKQQAGLEVSLPYQQFSSITGAWLCEQAPALRGVPAEEIQKRLLFGLRDLLHLTEADAEDAVLVGTGPAPDDPTRTLVQVRVTAPARIVPGGLHVDFGFTVAG